MTGWFHRRASLSATRREVPSGPPPTGNGLMMRTCLVGQLAAAPDWARAGASAPRARAPRARPAWRRLMLKALSFMVCLRVAVGLAGWLGPMPGMHGPLLFSTLSCGSGWIIQSPHCVTDRDLCACGRDRQLQQGGRAAGDGPARTEPPGAGAGDRAARNPADPHRPRRDADRRGPPPAGARPRHHAACGAGQGGSGQPARRARGPHRGGPAAQPGAAPDAAADRPVQQGHAQGPLGRGRGLFHEHCRMADLGPHGPGPGLHARAASAHRGHARAGRAPVPDRPGAHPGRAQRRAL
uniref:Predicted protein n=1 Tax=Physcomitrium patens TaxID=3218 RepID=A9U851_PHYPA